MIRPDENLEAFHLYDSAREIPAPDDTPYPPAICLLIWITITIAVWLAMVVAWKAAGWIFGKAIAQAAFDAAACAF
ncbi:hypothetical protein [Oceaniglobus ichthyenteri]|uniref:hypothetical protein n=1 Tax=Oceaniglobus ichthyenteri TaxID=2136177 RepID=UPI000D351781|nr:hypothetical protein [Oceaniglobus ichthyenteri]